MTGDIFFRQLSARPPFNKLTPQVASFFKDYLAHEKVISFGERQVINTNFPPFPSPAFDQLVEQYQYLGAASAKRLYSVTLAVTNRCVYDCWHCYNAGRSQHDIPLARLKTLARELQARGAVVVTLTGGEPLLRNDLEEIVGAFDARSCLILGTTGAGLTTARTRRLRDQGLFAMGISLDSTLEAEHDRLRGRPGAFQAALTALNLARVNGLYPYIVSVATRDFLRRRRFLPFLRFAATAGALEAHLLEPSANGKLAGRTDVLLKPEERRQLLAYQREMAQREDLPIVSTLAHLESAQAFGCGAGLTHLYIDGSGEVCPCNLVPLSFGNITREPLDRILDRLGRHFCQPRTYCVGRFLANQLTLGTAPRRETNTLDRAQTAPGQMDSGDATVSGLSGTPRVRLEVAMLPAPTERSSDICIRFLPAKHALPRFFRLRNETSADVGSGELRAAYDRVHGDYDEYWLQEAAGPVDDLVRKIDWRGGETVFEAGCGTGYATAQIAARAARVVAVDLSAAMLSEARQRLRSQPGALVQFHRGDALEQLAKHRRPFDLVFSSWVLGYIALKPFFAAAYEALVRRGRLAFVVHRENSPRVAMEIFAELVAENPRVLQKRVLFDFPRDAAHARAEVEAAGFKIEHLREDKIVFHYASPCAVLDHLLKSGAGTAFYDAINPRKRAELTRRFLALLAERNIAKKGFEVVHDYVACIARKP